MGQRFYVDDYFHIGQMHLGSGKPCQDYSFSGIRGNGAFVIVSDGCSTGGHTDVGARIITLSTVTALRQWLVSINLDIDKVSQTVTTHHKNALSESEEILSLTFSDTLATCLYVCLTSKGGLISVQGDGAVAKIYKDGTIAVTNYQWDNNTPLYPAYAEDNYENFIQSHGGDVNSKSLKIERHHHNADGFQIINGGIVLGDAIRGVTEIISPQEIESLSFVIIFTDGVMRVDGIHWKDAVLELLAFKNVEGEFAKRRMIRFIKDSKKDGKKGPLDDISFAVIRVDKEPEEV